MSESRISWRQNSSGNIRGGGNWPLLRVVDRKLLLVDNETSFRIGIGLSVGEKATATYRRKPHQGG